PKWHGDERSEWTFVRSSVAEHPDDPAFMLIALEAHDEASRSDRNHTAAHAAELDDMCAKIVARYTGLGSVWSRRAALARLGPERHGGTGPVQPRRPRATARCGARGGLVPARRGDDRGRAGGVVELHRGGARPSRRPARGRAPRWVRRLVPAGRLGAVRDRLP